MSMHIWKKYKKDQERDSAYTSSWARSLNDIRVDESADSKASGDAAQNMEESSTAAADTGMASGSYSETNVRQEGVDEGGIQLKQMEHTFTC